jgi:hypothetical protein
MLDRILVLQKPIDVGFVVHGFGNRFGGRFAIGPEQDFGIVLFVNDRRVEPNRDDDSDIVDDSLGDISVSNRVQNPVGDRSLDRAHEDIGVLLAVDGDLADHHGDGTDLHIAVEDRIDLGVSFRLVADHVGDREADWAIEGSDDYLGFCCRPGFGRFHQRFAGLHNDFADRFLLALARWFFLGHVVSLCQPRWICSYFKTGLFPSP